MKRWYYDRGVGCVMEYSDDDVDNEFDQYIADVHTDDLDGCLLAAAPDLLAACEALQAEFDKHFRREYVEPWLVARMDDIDAAVAKARGQE